MIDLIQVKSDLNFKNFKDDVTYFDDLTRSSIIYYEVDGKKQTLNLRAAIDDVENKKHKHLNIHTIKKITPGIITKWNSISALSSKEYVDDKVSEFKNSRSRDVILTTNDGRRFKLNIDNDGNLYTSEIH